MLYYDTKDDIPYARKFPQYVNFADFMVTYWYSENLICENLLVCNNWRFVTVYNMLLFHNEPVIRENIIAKILFASCSAKISYHENFHVYGSTLYTLWKLKHAIWLELRWLHTINQANFCISPLAASNIISTRSAVRATAITCLPLPFPVQLPKITYQQQGIYYLTMSSAFYYPW